MTFLAVDEWTATTAWSAFHQTNRKMTRYSNAVEKCSSIKLWWDQLAPVEKANVAKMDDFVCTCENIFEREREAWLATSRAVKMLSEAAKDGMAETETNTMQ